MDKEKKLQELTEELKSKQVHACEVYSRVVGYFRPVQNWNSGKREEWNERKKYSLN